MKALFNVLVFMFWTVVVVAVLITVVMGGGERVRTAQPTPLEVIISPDAAVAISADNNRSAEKLAEIDAANADKARAENTRRLRIVVGGLGVLVLAGCVLFMSFALIRVTRPASSYWPEEQTTVLFPGDPRFDRYLRDRGGMKVNGVPRLNGRTVTYIDVTPNRPPQNEL